MQGDMDRAEAARWQAAALLLERVLELPPGERESAAETLGGAEGVRAELHALLRGSLGESLLDEPLEEVLRSLPPAIAAPNALRGEVIGPWVLGEEIGRGGMSVVYHATRTGQDFRQQAAIKLLTVGHLGEDFVTGFLRERQILSDLQHPGIARLIDGGLTPDGVPYLVMQQVTGEPIDRWCRQRAADLATIIRLMLRLCDAVAYAHRHLVVHQDITPANVLVDEHQRPVLIDFGIARLLSPSARARPVKAFTPEYAAPEQRAGGVITTATDVFALGTLLRKLAEGRPRHPDLDAILEKATHAEPERRYTDARELADDLQAWRERRPVRAHPAGAGYRLGRFVARHRWGVAAGLVALVSLLGGLGVALWQARVAAAERDQARLESTRAQQVTEFLENLFRAADPDEAQGETLTARELLDLGAHQVRTSMQDTPELRAQMMLLLGDLQRELGEAGLAEPLLREGLALAEETGAPALRVEARRALALQRMEVGDHEQALALAEEGIALLARAGEIPGYRHSLLMHPLLFSLTELGRVQESADRARTVLRQVRSHADLAEPARFNYYYHIANVLQIAEQAAEAQPLLFAAADMGLDASSDPSVRIVLHSNLGGSLGRQGDYQGALDHGRRALALAEAIYPPRHVTRARMLSNLGSLLNQTSQPEEAHRRLREALAIYEGIYPDMAHPRVAAALNNLGQSLIAAGQFEAAEPHITRAWEMAGELFGEQDPRYVIALGNVGNLQRQLSRLEHAEELLIRNLELRESLLGPDHSAVGTAHGLLAALRLDQGRPAEALEATADALAVFQRAGYTNPRAIIAVATRRARALAALGRDGEARAAFDEALGLGARDQDDAAGSWSELLAAHADFLVERGDPGAREALVRALAAHEETLGATHPETRRMRHQLDDLEAGSGAVPASRPPPSS